ncbi:hypothetical protein PCANC_26903 [Puccinia coronata f. sp. avenae]|uniref:Uncharacterized protein n=1 Tax=Puccinia coronata f. sp. avenae TaxID=200324 RepID=A0A2N5TNA5_9BASI|nr:hypothetical protein PCANC_26903 [Puccinia coronata f. sp. avenae]
MTYNGPARGTSPQLIPLGLEINPSNPGPMGSPAQCLLWVLRRNVYPLQDPSLCGASGQLQPLPNCLTLRQQSKLAFYQLETNLTWMLKRSGKHKTASACRVAVEEMLPQLLQRHHAQQHLLQRPQHPLQQPQHLRLQAPRNLLHQSQGLLQVLLQQP